MHANRASKKRRSALFENESEVDRAPIPIDAREKCFGMYESACAALFMIRLSTAYFERTINLLEQHHARQIVRKRDFAER